MAPNLVLTAQHCVADTSKFVDCPTSVFGAVAAASRVKVTTSASIWSGDADWFDAIEVMLPPGAPAVCGRDMALVVLAAPIDRHRAVPIPPRLDASPGSRGGLRRHRLWHHRRRHRRRRRAAAARTLLRVVCVGGACTSRQVEDDEWRGDHGICNGDSGGPAIDSRGFVIGVTSRGPASCEAPIYGGLVGHAPWLRASAQRAAHDGAYAHPAWAGGGPDEPRGEAYEEQRAVAGCTVAGARDGGGAGWLVAALVLALGGPLGRRASRASRSR